MTEDDMRHIRALQDGVRQGAHAPTPSRLRHDGGVDGRTVVTDAMRARNSVAGRVSADRQSRRQSKTIRVAAPLVDCIYAHAAELHPLPAFIDGAISAALRARGITPPPTRNDPTQK